MKLRAGNENHDSSIASDSQRPFTFVSLVCLVIANMIGSGLYTTSGFSLSMLGDRFQVLTVWVAAGFMALCGAIAYGAIARRIPVSGGEYYFLARLVSPFMGFIAGWISLCAGFTAPIAAAALIFAVYSRDYLPFASINNETIAIGVIIVATLAVSQRWRIGIAMQNFSVGIKLVALMIFIVFGTVGYATVRSNPLPPAQLFSSGIDADTNSGLFWQMFMMCGALGWIALSYTGFNASIYVASDVRLPDRSLPRSMIVATLIVTVIYIWMNALFLYACPTEMISGEPRIAVIASRQLGGEGLAILMTFCIILSSWTSVLSLMMTGPQVYLAMSRDGTLPPSILGSMDSSDRTPFPALLLQAFSAVIIVVVSPLSSLLMYLGLTLTACGAITIAALWRIGKSYPELPVANYEYAAAAIYLVFTAAMIVAAGYFKPTEFYTMIGTFLVGSVCYFAFRKWKVKSSLSISGGSVP